MSREPANCQGETAVGKPTGTSSVTMQAPIKFELANQSHDRQGARLKIPEAFLLRADEVIE